MHQSYTIVSSLIKHWIKIYYLTILLTIRIFTIKKQLSDLASEIKDFKENFEFSVYETISFKDGQIGEIQTIEKVKLLTQHFFVFCIKFKIKTEMSIFSDNDFWSVRFDSVRRVRAFDGNSEDSLCFYVQKKILNQKDVLLVFFKTPYIYKYFKNKLFIKRIYYSCIRELFMYTSFWNCAFFGFFKNTFFKRHILKKIIFSQI